MGESSYTFYHNNELLCMWKLKYNGNYSNEPSVLSAYINTLIIDREGCYLEDNQSFKYKPPNIENGENIIGPPLEWSGPAPLNYCELFIGNIPKHLNKYEILTNFLRFGKVYEFRLIMNPDCPTNNKGYAFIKYTCIKDASKAMQVMNNFYIVPGKLLNIKFSYDNCRLYIGNLPTNLSKMLINVSLMELFPNITYIIHRKGYAFIDLPSHQDAKAIKERFTPDAPLRMWGRNLRIAFAKIKDFNGMHQGERKQ